MESIYSLVNGTVTNLQGFDEASCDMAMRQLTDILSSYHHKQSSAKPLIVIPCDHVVSEDLFDEEICRINENIESSQYQLQHTEKRLISAQHTMKSLGLKIRFKEELIKELVKNNSAFQCLNKAYQTKINNLEKEYQQLKLQVVKLNIKHPYEHTSTSQSEIQSTSRGEELSVGRTKRKKAKSAVLLKAAELETKEKKLKETESKLLILQRRRQDTLRILNMGEKGEKRVSVLEGELERLRNQQGALKKKLKGESYRKRNLEEEVHQYKLQIKNLSESNKHQSQVIRVKTQEAAVAQRRLRNCQPGQLNNQIRNQKWFDQEIEKIVQQKHALEEFQKELLEREVIITNQEQLMKERFQLQTKLNQSSEAVTIKCSQEMKNINQMIVAKEKFKVSFSGQSLKDLEREISSLRDKREKLSDVFNLRSELSPDGVLSSDETRLMEVSEQIEVLETLLKIKNDDSINNFQTVQSVGSEMNGLSSKILALPTEEARLLLSVYINKIIKLRQVVEKSKRNQMELQNQLSRQTQIVQNLEQSLDQSQIDKELRLSRLHKEHAKEVQVLLHHMTNSEDPVHNDEEMLTTRVKELERDLYYYKKTARDLKRKLKLSVRTSSNTKENKSTIVKDSLEL